MQRQGFSNYLWTRTFLMYFGFFKMEKKIWKFIHGNFGKVFRKFSDLRWDTMYVHTCFHIRYTTQM